MGIGLIIFLIVVAIIALLIFWFIAVQRHLVHQDELCGNAMSQIGVQQSSRWDALSALADLTKGYAKHEYETLRDVIAQRKNITADSSATDANHQEALLGHAMAAINATIERYPDLKANESFRTTMDSVNKYENQVRVSRMVFNDTVTKYNQLIRQVPSNIVAMLLHFNKRDYLQEDPAKTDMPSMKMS